MPWLVGLFSSIAGKVIGLLAILASLLAVYLGIKRSGKLEERHEWEAATTEAKVKMQSKVLEAVSADTSIDLKVEAEKKRITEASTPAKGEPDELFRF